LNTESAIKAIEDAKSSAQSAQKAAQLMLESISKFYEVIGDDSWNDVRTAWQTLQDIENGNTLFKKLSVVGRIKPDLCEINDETITITLSSPKISAPKNRFKIELNRKECTTLAHILLKESGVTK
jgi:hypothetical protein